VKIEKSTSQAGANGAERNGVPIPESVAAAGTAQPVHVIGSGRMREEYIQQRQAGKRHPRE